MIEAFCDGGSRGNPGPAAFGYLVKIAGRVVHKDFGYIGIATNNFAEYTAVIKALNWLQKQYQGHNLKFYLDSQLVVLQLSGLYKVKKSHIRDLVFKIRSLETSFGQVSYYYLPRENNKEADRLVNQALDKHYGVKTILKNF